MADTDTSIDLVDTSVMERNLQNILNEKFGGAGKRRTKKASKKASKKTSKKASKKSSVKRASVKKSSVKRSSVKKSSVKRASVKKSSVKRASVKKGGKREMNPYMKARSSLVKLIFAEAKKKNVKLSISDSANIIKKLEADVIKETKLNKDTQKVEILEKAADHLKKNYSQYIK